MEIKTNRPSAGRRQYSIKKVILPNEGIIKFKAHWKRGELPSQHLLPELIHWRQVLYEAGLIGAYPDGTGYGNISRRIPGSNEFLISGSATGTLPVLTEAHFAWVKKVDMERNELWCQGPVVASSESMSHAAVYQAWPQAGAVVHIHQAAWWKKWRHRLPTTDPAAEYGTVAMARSIAQLTRHIITSRLEAKVIIMAGHPEGIIAFGKDLQTAAHHAMHPGQSS